MPLINPEIQKALRHAAEVTGDAAIGGRTPTSNIDGEPTEVEQHLQNAGMGLEEAVNELAHLAKNSGNEGLRLRAIEDTLKLHKVMKEDGAALPVINIIIMEAPGADKRVIEDVNRIFIPRELLKSHQTTETGSVN